ncbi:hypothetical protein HKCCE3408_08890 [Rhodobacterales bacterium HKCCE3408]|nr:hypothetical protein [Rhodobacterales bacterium HKCCE3408]
MIRALIAGLAAALIVPVAAYLGLGQALGAHPFWDVQTAWIGAAIGLVAGLVFARLPGKAVLPAFALLALGAWGAAAWGKARFAASFADDRFAGQIWYVGFILAAAAAAACLVSAALRLSFPRRAS